MGRPLTEEQVAEIRRLFPNHTKNEIRELTGFGLSTIDRIQARFHLRKSPEHIHNMGVRAGTASGIARGGDNSACCTPEAIAKRVASYKKTFREEQVRRRWGGPSAHEDKGTPSAEAESITALLSEITRIHP